jgi:hypothetical protein
MLKSLCAGLIGFSLVIGSLIVGAQENASENDLWVHPRGETYDPERHYRDGTGELYYKAENDIERALGDVIVDGVGSPRISVELGADLWRVLAEAEGSLQPLFLYDASGDGVIDRSVRGRIEGNQAVFDSPRISQLDLRRMHWQIGVRYVAGSSGDTQLDRRYLASVDSKTARVKFRRVDELAHVGAGGFIPGLVILKHREGAPFDFAEFAENPARYIEDFEALTRQKDADDWTADGPDGRLVTHFEREDLFIVRTRGDFTLDLEWGDMPIVSFLEEYLHVRANPDGCYSTLHAELTNDDGSPAVSPHRVLYCPEDSVALFDAPDGYQIGLSALREGEVHERTQVGTSIADNVRLYVREIYPRSPSRRATGSVTGNIRAGFTDARKDLKDVLRHAVTGTREANIHTGREGYRASPLSAVPRALLSLVRLKPAGAIPELVTGIESAVKAGADVISAVDNAVLNPILQLTVGTVATPEAADTGGDWIGAVTQAAAKNLPFGERSVDALSPVSLWRHNRAFQPADYTRTDTQLNIDRVMTVANLVTISAIRKHNDDSHRGGGDGGSSEGGDSAASVPNPGPDSGSGATGSNPGPGSVGKVGKCCKKICASRGAPHGKIPRPRTCVRALKKLARKFCHHPILDKLLPVKF